VKIPISIKKYLLGRRKTVVSVLGILALLNFTVFWFVAISIGGDAVNGKVADGRYYLANHGVLTEVSHPVYLYSYIHVLSVFVTHSLFVLSALVVYFVRDTKKT
jgi:hypothetical protein